MQTSLITRITAAAAACLITFSVVLPIAHYAYPESPAVVLASASR